MTDVIPAENIVKTLPDNQIVPIHFKIEQHFIPLGEFITSAKAAQGIIDNLNKELFLDQLNIKIVVVPPKEGTFLEQIGMIVTANSELFTLGTVWLALKSDEGKALLRGLTGHELPYWFELAGQQLKKGGQKAIVDSREFGEAAIAWILKHACIGFLEKPSDELKKIGVTTPRFRKACSAKNAFYKACATNQNIKAIGFDSSENFTVTRESFASHWVDLPDPVKAPEETHWISEIVDVEANSPNWDREGRKWQGKIKDGKGYKDVTFEIEDNAFWQLADTRSITPSIRDSIRLQWVYPEGGLRRTNIRVLKVLSYNGRKLASSLSQTELDEILYSHEADIDIQPDFFKSS